MKGNDELNLAACLLALLRYDEPLPPELDRQIQQAKDQLETQPEQAVQTLRQAFQEYEPLQSLYLTSRSHLVTQSNSQERAKSAWSIVIQPPLAITKTVSLPTNAPLDIVQLAARILTLPSSGPPITYRTRAQYLLRQPTLRQRIDQSAQALQSFAHSFADAADELHPTKVALMKKLERKILTLDDIAYSLGLSMESTRSYVKNLWNEGYIRPISGNIFKQICLSLKGAPRLTQPPASDTCLKLTVKGYFYLHPGTLSKRKVV